jgi:hypothetical protein
METDNLFYPDGDVFKVYILADVVTDLGETIRWILSVVSISDEELNLLVAEIRQEFNLKSFKGTIYTSVENRDDLIKGCLSLLDKAVGINDETKRQTTGDTGNVDS